jgi:hypothetical protein
LAIAGRARVIIPPVIGAGTVTVRYPTCTERYFLQCLVFIESRPYIFFFHTACNLNNSGIYHLPPFNVFMNNAGQAERFRNIFLQIIEYYHLNPARSSYL